MSVSQANRLDITDKVRFGANDANLLPLERCVCGDESESWEFTLDTDPHYKSECPECGRKMWFSVSITVWQEVAPKVVPDAAEGFERPKEASILVAPRPVTPLSEAMDGLIRGVFNARGHRKMTE